MLHRGLPVAWPLPAPGGTRLYRSPMGLKKGGRSFLEKGTIEIKSDGEILHVAFLRVDEYWRAHALRKGEELPDSKAGKTLTIQIRDR